MKKHDCEEAHLQTCKEMDYVIVEKPSVDQFLPDDLLGSLALSFESDENFISPSDSFLDSSSNASLISNPSSVEYFSITVSDPQKEYEQTISLIPVGNTYYSYLITTRTNLPEYGGPGSEFSVRRRFSDFVTLSNWLSESHQGYFLPARPGKNMVETYVMQTQEFLEKRMVELEKYLRKLAAHLVIRKSEEMRVFLKVKGKLPKAKRSATVEAEDLNEAAPEEEDKEFLCKPHAHNHLWCGHFCRRRTLIRRLKIF